MFARLCLCDPCGASGGVEVEPIEPSPRPQQRRLKSQRSLKQNSPEAVAAPVAAKATKGKDHTWDAKQSLHQAASQVKEDQPKEQSQEPAPKDTEHQEEERRDSPGRQLPRLAIDTAQARSTPRSSASFPASPRSARSACKTPRSARRECAEVTDKPDFHKHQASQGKLHKYMTPRVGSNNRAIIEDSLADKRRDLEAMERIHGLENMEIVEPMEILAFACGKIGRFTEQIELLNRAIKIMEVQLGPEDPEIAETLVELAVAHGRQGGKGSQVKKDMLEKALAIQMGVFGSGSAEAARTKVRLANACGDLGSVREKVRLLTDALKVLEVVHGEEHAEVAATLTNLGNAYMVLGSVEEQRDALERSLHIKERLYGERHPELATTLTSLANACGRQGDLERQKELLERALDISQQHNGPDHWRLAVILDNMGALYLRLGEASEALLMLEHALNIKEAHYGKEHPDVAVTLANLGFAHGEEGNDAKKLELLKTAEAILVRTCGPTHPQTRRVKSLSAATSDTMKLVLSLLDPLMEDMVWCTVQVPGFDAICGPTPRPAATSRDAGIKATALKKLSPLSELAPSVSSRGSGASTGLSGADPGRESPPLSDTDSDGSPRVQGSN